MVPDASAGSILPPKTASTCIKLNVLGATSVLFQLCEVQAEDEKYGGWEWRWRWWAGGGYNTAKDADENEDEQQDWGCEADEADDEDQEDESNP